MNMHKISRGRSGDIDTVRSERVVQWIIDIKIIEKSGLKKY